MFAVEVERFTELAELMGEMKNHSRSSSGLSQIKADTIVQTGPLPASPVSASIDDQQSPSQLRQ